MDKYIVVGLVDATVSEEVEASSPEEAGDRASLSASVCHQCSSEIEVGDVYVVQVLDEDGDVVIPFEADAEPARLRAEVDRLKEMCRIRDSTAARAAEYRKLKRLKEAARSYMQAVDRYHPKGSLGETEDALRALLEESAAET